MSQDFSHWVMCDLAKLYRAKDNPTKAQEHYAIAHQMFTNLGAEGELRMKNGELRNFRF